LYAWLWNIESAVLRLEPLSVHNASVMSLIVGTFLRRLIQVSRQVWVGAPTGGYVSVVLRGREYQ